MYSQNREISVKRRKALFRPTENGWHCDNKTASQRLSPSRHQGIRTFRPDLQTHCGTVFATLYHSVRRIHRSHHRSLSISGVPNIQLYSGKGLWDISQHVSYLNIYQDEGSMLCNLSLCLYSSDSLKLPVVTLKIAFTAK